jgi:hypothetical protein
MWETPNFPRANERLRTPLHTHIHVLFSPCCMSCPHTHTLTQAPWRGVAKRVLLISGVHPPPDDPEEAAFYDVLVHETQWYAPQVGEEPRTVPTW